MSNEMFSPAHKLLADSAGRAKACLVRMLNEGSRDYEVLDAFYADYKNYQRAADVVSGQVKHPQVVALERVRELASVAKDAAENGSTGRMSSIYRAACDGLGAL